MKLFYFYFEKAGNQRIHTTSTMKKYQDAYVEAAAKLQFFASPLTENQSQTLQVSP